MLSTYHSFAMAQPSASTMYQVLFASRQLRNGEWVMKIRTLDGMEMDHLLTNVKRDPLVTPDALYIHSNGKLGVPGVMQAQ